MASPGLAESRPRAEQFIETNVDRNFPSPGPNILRLERRTGSNPAELTKSGEAIRKAFHLLNDAGVVQGALRVLGRGFTEEGTEQSHFTERSYRANWNFTIVGAGINFASPSYPSLEVGFFECKVDSIYVVPTRLEILARVEFPGGQEPDTIEVIRREMIYNPRSQKPLSETLRDLGFDDGLNRAIQPIERLDFARKIPLNSENIQGVVAECFMEIANDLERFPVSKMRENVQDLLLQLPKPVDGKISRQGLLEHFYGHGIGGAFRKISHQPFTTHPLTI